MADDTKAMAETSMHRFACEWWLGLGLELYGTDLADALEYDLLRIQGNVWKKYFDAPAAPAEMPQGSAVQP